MNFIVMTLYRKHDDSRHGHPSTAKDFEDAINAIKKTLRDVEDNLPLIVAGGDFNLPHSYSNKHSSSKEEKMMIQILQDLCFEQSLTQVIYNPTHKDENILYLILTNDVQHNSCSYCNTNNQVNIRPLSDPCCHMFCNRHEKPFI